MSELSKLLGTSSPPHQIAHDGRTYTFHLLTATRRNALEKRFYQNAREAVYVDREFMSEKMYMDRLDGVRKDYELNKYGFFGEIGAEILKTPAGALRLLEVITDETEDDLMPLLTARAAEVNALVKTVMNESFKQVKPKIASLVPNG